MEAVDVKLSPQEERIEKGQGKVIELFSEYGAQKRPRVNRILASFSRQRSRLSVDRAYWFTESFKSTEHLPLVLRWAKGIQHVCENLPVFIGKDDLIVGRCGPLGRYGILYPELEGAYFAQMGDIPEKDDDRPYILEKEDIRIIKEVLTPYWAGKTFHEALGAALPEDTKHLFYTKGDIYQPSFVLHQTATVRHSIQWVLDYEKVLNLGFNGIKEQAEKRLAALDVFDTQNNYGKKFFYEAVIIICEAMVTFARRHAELAETMAHEEEDPARKGELLEMAEICRHVPGEPARNFHEAVQSQWFAQVGSRMEQIHGGVIGNGRIDQYLYPFYKQDKQAGKLSDDQALELLECLWLNMAQCVRLQPTPAGFKIYEGSAHFEHTTVGGLKIDGTDATNELSYLILESKREFPLDYPDLSVRIHAGTPEPFLHQVCELIKEGTGFPKLMNDEEIIPILLAKGATLEEARNYNPSGCTEVRLANRNTYFTGTTWMNMPAILEMTLLNGRVRTHGDELMGLATGDPRDFATWEEFWEAFRQQLINAQRHVFIQQYLTDVIRPEKLGAPLLSSLHDLCMDQGKDVNQGKLEGGLSLGGQTGVVGFGTVIDSLAAIKKLVYEDKSVSMDDMLSTLANNFEGHELVRQRCLNAPKYGNLIPWVDAIGRDIEGTLLELFDSHVNAYGGRPELFYVPVTAHVAMGRVIGATPNGRRQGEPLSEGISPSQGCDTMGPTATLQSIAATKATPHLQRAARLLNVKLSPKTVDGEEGTKKLASLIRAWCDQKHWHIQFSIVNRQTLLAAQKDPEKYRNLIVRVAGYSAYFVDLSTDLQNEIIARTEHTFA